MRRIFERRVGLVLIAVALFLVLNSVATACPNCKEAMEKQDPTHGGMVKGYFYSILFMMGTPYLVLGTFCAAMYYRVRRARRAGKPKAPLAGAAVVSVSRAGTATHARPTGGAREGRLNEILEPVDSSN
jgi:heme/copper-type cytochrome/quinol oxidase subunit 2